MNDLEPIILPFNWPKHECNSHKTTACTELEKVVLSVLKVKSLDNRRYHGDGYEDRLRRTYFDVKTAHPSAQPNTKNRLVHFYGQMHVNKLKNPAGYGRWVLVQLVRDNRQAEIVRNYTVPVDVIIGVWEGLRTGGLGRYCLTYHNGEPVTPQSLRNFLDRLYEAEQ